MSKTLSQLDVTPTAPVLAVPMDRPGGGPAAWPGRRGADVRLIAPHSHLFAIGDRPTS